jgi:hypothetical protein
LALTIEVKGAKNKTKPPQAAGPKDNQKWFCGKGLFLRKILAAKQSRHGIPWRQFFCQGQYDLFRLCKGIMDESFGRISLFPGFAPGIF